MGTHPHPELLQNLDVIEDRSGIRRKQGLPARYSKGRLLGKGGFAKCYEVQDCETKEVFAAKIVAKASIAKPRAHAKLRSEIAIHRSLDHDKVVKFYDYFEDSEYVYIILELCPNQTLNEFMRKRPSRRLSEAEAMFYIYDLIVALKYLHRHKVIHRDLKLGNLFLDADVRLKVGDFGLAAQLEHDGEKKRTICGTPNYIAPEILEGKHGHSYEVDVWSLGVILYTMVIGRPPFETSDVKTTYRRIRYNQYGFPETVRVSEQVKDLITCILRTDPRSRPSLDEIIASSWFQGAQRLPPPMPMTVSAFAISPRVASGGSSARSETPERGVADFARIDSPVPRFPLRDRPLGTVPTTGGAAQHPPTAPHHPPLRGQSATPVLGSKPPPLAGTTPYSGSGATTPGRCPSSGGFPNSGRPPLAHRGNEENVVPVQHANVCAPQGGDIYGGYATPMSPANSQGLLGSNGGLTCRPQSAHLASCNSTARMTPTNSHTPPPAVQATPAQAATAVRSGSGGLPHAVARESSPLLSVAGTPVCSSVATAAATSPAGPGGGGAGSNGPTTSAAKVATAGYATSRSNTCSPRQHPSLPLSGRLAPCVSTPKENQSRSARGAGSIASDGGPYAGSLFTKTTPSVLRSNAPPLSSRNLPAAGESPNHQLNPGVGDMDIVTARAPSATPSATPSHLPCERKQLSARRNERCSSSPALLVEGLMACTQPAAAAVPSPWSAAQKHDAGGLTQRSDSRLGYRSGRSTPVAPCEVASGHAPASGSRQCPSPGPQQAACPAAQMASALPAGANPELWVTKWVDYSSKYGVGYILSDGSIGVYFNDSTKIILVPDGSQFDYVTRRTQEKPEARTTHSFEDYPEDLKKKVTLLRHFKNYMVTDVLEKKDGATVGESLLPAPQTPAAPRPAYEPGNAPYVKKWTRNRHAIMFQLSNKIVQVVFFDKTEAVLSSKSHTVTYVDKRGQVCCYPLSNVLDVPSPELAKRLRYTKDILVNMLGARSSEFAGVH